MKFSDSTKYGFRALIEMQEYRSICGLVQLSFQGHPSHIC